MKNGKIPQTATYVSQQFGSLIWKTNFHTVFPASENKS